MPLMANTFLAAAQPSSPVVPRINPQTMIMSLLLSRWKHMVWTSSSEASLQISRFCDKQNDLVQREQEGEVARAASLSLLSGWVEERTPKMGTEFSEANGELVERRSGS